MKQFIRSLTAVLLAFCLAASLPASGFADELLTYQEAVERLDSISLTDEKSLTLVYDSLNAIGNLRYARQYKLIAEALIVLAKGESSRFDEIEFGLNMLIANSAFTADYLSHENLSYVPFESLLTYLSARRLESAGNLEDAYALYAQAQILDSLDRGIAIMQSLSGQTVPPEPTPVPQATAMPATDASEFTFETQEDQTLLLTGYSGLDVNVVIPEAVDGQTVSAIGEYAFYSCDTMTSVVIPKSVTSVGYGAFYYCTGLASVLIADGVTSIGEDAFYYCESLSEVSIPSSVVFIGDGAFLLCSSLTDIDVSDGNPAYLQMGGVLFEKDRKMVHTYPIGKSDGEYVIPEGTLAIGPYAFYGSGLQKITLPESVTEIGEFSFYNCASLDAALLPPALAYIGQYAFNGCYSLTEMFVPSGVTFIGESAFELCENLPSILVSEDNLVYAQIDGVLFDKELNMLHTYPCGKADSSYIVPDGTLILGPSAFYYGALQSISIPESVTEIGSYSLSCTQLLSVTLPKSVNDIGYCAFDGCASLSEAVVLGSPEIIPYEMFNGCENLRSFVIPESAYTIEDYAFYGCSSLASVTIPQNVTEFGEELFTDCGNLTILCPAGSPAETFAMDNDIPYITDGTLPRGSEVTVQPSGPNILDSFSAAQVTDLYGNAFDPSIFLARPTLVNIWATWCGPCVREIPYLAQLAGEYEGRINIVGLQTDAVGYDMTLDEDALSSARALFDANESSYPNLIPTENLMNFINDMRVDGIPTTWFVDANGYIVDEQVGAKSLSGWRKAIDAFLEKAGE